jgi:hypothetical protein
MTRKELERLVQGLADKTLTEEEFAALQDELKESAEARAFFRESMQVELLLGEAMHMRLPGMGSDEGMARFLRQRQRRNVSRALLMAAAVLTVMALVLFWYSLAPQDHRMRVAFTPGSAWAGDLGEGGWLEPGEPLVVDYGVVEVRLSPAVRGIIEGPAEFVVRNPALLELRRGRAWFRIEEPGRGFQVHTPQCEIRDLGTEFGLTSRPNTPDEVHVFEGRVQVRARFAMKEERALKAGGALRVSPVGRWIDAQPDASAFLKTLPQGLPGIRFTFDGRHPLRPEGEHPAVAGMMVHTHSGKPPVLVDGVRGSALKLGEAANVVVTDWPGIAGDEPRTIACWVRCADRNDPFTTLVSWGAGTRDIPSRCKLMMADLPGHRGPLLRFSLGHYVNFTGQTPLQRGRWHHVAVVFRGLQSEYGEMVELYVDGRRDKADSELTRPPKEDAQISTLIDAPDSQPLRIGAGPYGEIISRFVGEIDEVVILPRAVSPVEVQGLMNR